MRVRFVLALAVCVACDPGAIVAPPSGTWVELSDAVAYDVGGTVLTRLSAAQVLGGGQPDLVTVARGDRSVRVLADIAAGVPTPPAVVRIGSDARDALVADIDHDGHPDLVATGHFDNAVFLRRGDGSGGFGAEASYPLRNHGHFIVAANLDGDEFTDIVAVHDGSGQPVYVTAFLGSASGALQPVWESATPYLTAKGLERGDFDGDGRTDIAIAVADNRASVLVFRGSGSGAFAAPLVLPTLSPDPDLGDGTAALAVGDLNGDGRDDLVVARADMANALVVRLSTGAGFGPPAEIPLPSPIDVALGDVSGDGRLDAVAANLEHGTVSLLINRGDGRFEAPRTIAAGVAPSWVAVADLDGDGFADVAVSDLADHRVRVLLSRRAPAALAPPRPASHLGLPRPENPESS